MDDRFQHFMKKLLLNLSFLFIPALVLELRGSSTNPHAMFVAALAAVAFAVNSDRIWLADHSDES